MIQPFSPTPDSLIGLFNRRGTASHYIVFSGSDVSANRETFGCELFVDEEPVLKISPSASSGAAWLTTKRLIWTDADDHHEVLLVEIIDAVPMDFDKAPVPNSDVLRIKTISGRIFDIRMPDPGVLHGMWGVLDRYARRNARKNKR